MEKYTEIERNDWRTEGAEIVLPCFEHEHLRSSAYMFDDFNSIETTFTCSVLLSSSSESGKSLMGTKPVPDQEELREISSKGIQRRNEKEKQEKHPAFSHCLNPLRVCTSLLSQIGIKNRPKIYWNLLEIRSKREIISKRLVASCCTATEAKS